MTKFTMVGTEKTGSYVGVANKRAQVGYRDLGHGAFRVRVEPVEGERETLAASFAGWKTGMGGGEFRFSKVVHGEEALKATVGAALKATASAGRIAASEGCPDWVVEAAKGSKPETEAQERERLIAAVKAMKIPGCNFAAQWSLATLRSKVS